MRDSSTPTEIDAAPDDALGTAAEIDNCVFCLEPTSQPCIARPCGHWCFDFLCLTSWLLEYHPTCPLCKSQVSTVAYGDHFESILDIKKESLNKRKCESARAGHFDEGIFVGETGVFAPAPLTQYRPEPRPRSRPRSRPRPRHRQRLRIVNSTSTPEDEALEERRRVYRLGLYARHIGANGRSRHYQDLTPSMFQQDPDLTSRARSFIRRELQVLWREHGLSTRQRTVRNRHQLIEYIVLILKSLDIQGNGNGNGNGIEEMLAQDLGSASVARHFLHELRCFLRSPYLTVTAWDRHVQYGQSRFEDNDEEVSGNDSELDRQERRQRREQQRADIAQREEWFRPRLDPDGTSGV